MKYFTRAASNLNHWSAKSRWRRLWSQYEQELASILPELTPGWRELAGIDFNYTKVFAIERRTESELLLQVDMAPT